MTGSKLLRKLRCLGSRLAESRVVRVLFELADKTQQLREYQITGDVNVPNHDRIISF